MKNKWIELNLPYGNVYDKKFNELDSFCKRNLNKAGILIEVKEGKKLNKYLIGDINILGGVCDDCTAFDKEAIVKRYMVISLENIN